MPGLGTLVIVFAALSGLGLLGFAVVVGVRQKAISKYSDVRKALDEFTQTFEPGDLVWGPRRLRHGRAQAHLQTAEHHYAMGKKELVENTRFWKALGCFLDAEAHLESARQEVALAAVEAS